MVYATITDIVDGAKGNKSIKFKHLSGTAADHAWTTDKNKRAHCYGQLEEGSSYLIVTVHTGNRRWQWTKCWLMTKKELKIVNRLCGVRPTYEELEEALIVIKELRNPPPKPVPPELTDLIVF